MSTDNSKSTKLDKHMRRLAWVLFFLGVGFWVWGVVIFIVEPLIWERAMRTIAVGFLVWCLALGAARDYPAPFHWAAGIIERISGLLRIDLSTPDRRFGALGLITCATAVYLFAVHYNYVFRLLGVQIGLVLAGAATGWYSHLWLYRGVANLSARFYESEWRKAAGVWGIYLMVWAALLAGPFGGWEALGTEPILKQLVTGLAFGLALCWLALGSWRGPESKIHKPALIVAAILLAAISGWNLKTELFDTKTPKQRVILLTLDTTRADYLSCYGYPRETSPNLDKLASSGVRFARAFSQAGLTDPSHASILTGTYPRTHGLDYNLKSITGNVPSMAEYFNDRGYVTAAVISRDHVLPTELNVSGFEDMIGVKRWIGKTDGPEAFRRAANYLYKYRDRDLFLWVHFFDPHDSYEPHPGYSDKFYGEDRGRRLVKRYGVKYSEEEVKYMRDLYAGEIYYMDYWIGRLLELARSMEPVPDTPLMVAAVADHGEFLGEYMEHPIKFGFGHGPIYNIGVHVPLIFSWPGHIPEGVVVDDIVQSIDIAPTIVDYVLGADYPGQGHSLKDTIGGADYDHIALIYNCKNRDWMDSQYKHIYAVVKDEMKYMITEKRNGELFDLEKDWYEKNDISSSKPDVVDDLTREWEGWIEKTPKAEPDNREMNESEIKTLKALGYIE